MILQLKGEIDQLKLDCNSPPKKKEIPNLQPCKL